MSRIGKNIFLSILLNLFITKLIKKYSLNKVHLHCGPGGLFLLKKLDIPIIATCHHTYWQQYKYIKGQKWKKVFCWFEKATYKISDQIICVSVDSKSILTAEYNINPEKIIVIPNGVNTNKFYPIKSIKQVENSLLYVGRIDERKGVDFLIKSMTLVKLQNPKVKLFIGGRGKKLFELRKYVKKYNLQNNIKFIGFIPDTKLNKCYNKVKCVVVPSIFEGFGLTVIEAMAAGAPVIGTDVDGIRTIIRNGKNGYLVEYGDTESLSNMILNVLQNDNSEVIRNELITVKSEYNWDEISKKVGEIYDEL